MRESKYAFVGTGFTFDLTEFFKFEMKKEIQPGGLFGTIYAEISGSGIALIILIFSVANSSLITVWILTTKINKFLALTWRFIFQALLTVPFMLH